MKQKKERKREEIFTKLDFSRRWEILWKSKKSKCRKI